GILRWTSPTARRPGAGAVSGRRDLPEGEAAPAAFFEGIVVWGAVPAPYQWPSLNSTVVVGRELASWPSTATSGRPSPLKSATITLPGAGPAANCWAGPKVPSPLPSIQLTVPPAEFAVTTSSLPSPLKSPSAAPVVPVGAARAVRKVPSPFPS